MEITVNADANNTKYLLTLLEEMGYSLPCNCQGKHRCPGARYAFDCSMIPKSPITVQLPKEDSDVKGIALENRTLIPGSADTLLIDLGTTTIALVLMDKKSGLLRQSHVFPNPQRSFGTDVISRIQASCEGKGKMLKNEICLALSDEAARLCQKNGQTKEEIRCCLIGGNTTMIHLLMGYDCSPLAASPFIPKAKCPDRFSHGQTTIRILPWLSAFIGGDIMAGILACGLADKDGPSLLVDLGTNGEMVLAHRKKLYAAATAAGPALEGGSLSCGCAAVEGAVSSVRLQRGRAVVKTIGNKIPIGLCGSGALTLCAELLRHNLIDNEGILSDSFPENGILLGRDITGSSLYFTADDLRRLQLAVASIGAGIDTLCFEAGIHPASLEQMYLGGGFGFFLPIEDVIRLRMIPSLPPERIRLMGNTCLQGLWQFAANPANNPEFPACSVIDLASHPFYKKRFLSHMTYSDDVSSTTNA